MKSNHGNKTYQSRLTRWINRLLPFNFNMEHIAGTKIGLVDYISRNPVGEADPKYDTSFIVATINDIKRNIAKALVDQRSTICPNLKEIDQKLKNSQTKGRQTNSNSKIPACMEQSYCSNKHSMEQSHRSN